MTGVTVKKAYVRMKNDYNLMKMNIKAGDIVAINLFNNVVEDMPTYCMPENSMFKKTPTILLDTDDYETLNAYDLITIEKYLEENTQMRAANRADEVTNYLCTKNISFFSDAYKYYQKEFTADKPVFAVCAYIEKDEKIYAISRKDNFEIFGFPGGKTEPNEDPLISLIRELEEEVGIKFDSEDFELAYSALDSSCNKRVDTYKLKNEHIDKYDFIEGVGPEKTIIKFLSKNDIINNSTFKYYNYFTIAHIEKQKENNKVLKKLFRY